MPERVEPGLKPYQPNHRMTAPMLAMVRSCGGVAPPPSRLNLRPRRGPRAMAPARAREPPTVCTTVEPAKSRKTVPPVQLWNQPMVLPSQPPGPQTQWPKMGKMKPDTMALYRMSPLNDVRPTMAPKVMVDAVSAKANWNRKKASKATLVEPYAAVIPCRKKNWWPI